MAREVFHKCCEGTVLNTWCPVPCLYDRSVGGRLWHQRWAGGGGRSSVEGAAVVADQGEGEGVREAGG